MDGQEGERGLSAGGRAQLSVPFFQLWDAWEPLLFALLEHPNHTTRTVAPNSPLHGRRSSLRAGLHTSLCTPPDPDGSRWI